MEEQCIHMHPTLFFSNTNTTFRNNSSNKGGGVYLACKSFWFLLQDTRVIMVNNTAAYQRGAIYVKDTDSNIYCLPNQLKKQIITLTDLTAAFFNPAII